MTFETVAFLLLGAVAGGFINGLSGTGMALFSLGFYLVVLEPEMAVAIVALMSVLVGLQGLWIVRSDIFARPGRLARFAIPGLIGVPIGLMLLSFIDASILRFGIATLLIIFGLVFGFRRALPTFSRPTPWVDGGVGFAGGVLGGSAAVSGALPVLWLSLRPWTKSETRAVLQPFNMAILGTTVVLLFFRGAFDETALKALLIIVPACLIAAQIGIYVFGKISSTGFRRLLILLNLAMGAGILAGELF